jgi:hypothetical protein
MELPSCLDCKYGEQGHPCRMSGATFDYEKVGRGYVLYGRSFARDGENVDPEGREANAWAGDCAFEIEEDFPDMLLPLTVAAIDACETSQDAAYVAAGLLENAVVKHGPRLIGKIERLAAESPKFRYFLSGIWGGTRADPEIWGRVCRATGNQGQMDADGRGPSAGGPLTVLGEDDVRAMLKTRVADVAAKADL